MNKPKFEYANYFPRGDLWIVRVLCYPPTDPQVRRHTLFFEAASEKAAQTLCWCLMGDSAPTEPLSEPVIPDFVQPTQVN